jgi:hypothetical protein
MIFLTIGGAFAFVLFLLWIRTAMARRRVTKKAHADYASCRGTLHARQLRAGITKHELALRSLTVEQNRMDSTIESLERCELNELRQALARSLVNGPLSEVHGVGSRLRDRIVETCFDGTLESLNEVQQVPCVGPDMALEISTWVQQMTNRLPELLKNGFEGKAAIKEVYDRQRSDLAAQRIQHEQTIQSMRDMLSHAKRKLTNLELATPAVYRRALEGDAEAAERVAAHTIGVFPEWAPAPEWFAELVREPERKLNEV